MTLVLVTGATGFVGRALLRRLSDAGYAVRTLLRPSRSTPNLPRGTPVEVALSSLSDRRGLRASMVGVRAVIHLAGREHRTVDGRQLQSDAEGTHNLAETAAESGVDRLVFLSHLGSEPASAYPALRAKALAEGHIRRSGVPFTIVRSGLAYGVGDWFTTSLAMLMAILPGVLPIPGDGSNLIQPIWVEDLATGLVWTLEEPSTLGQTYEVGGPEHLTCRETVELIMRSARMRRALIPSRPPYLRLAARLVERLLPRPPVTTFWLDYLAASRTAEIGTLPRVFGLIPSRMQARLEYLRGYHWGRELLVRQVRGRSR